MVSSISIKHIQPEKLFLSLLPRLTRRALLACIKLPLFKQWGLYLAGGTALTLLEGHRQSVDLDFFSTQIQIRETAVERALLATGKWQTSFQESGTLYGVFMEAKMSFIAYPFFIPSGHYLQYGTVKVLVPSDIAAMKIIAISQRCRKRDFVDLYWYCKNRESLALVIKRAVKQYPGQKNNMPHLLKSLTYFADAEEDPMPKIFFKATWNGIKKFFRGEVRKLSRELLGLC